MSFTGHNHNFNQRCCARIGSVLISLRAIETKLQQRQTTLDRFFIDECGSIPPTVAAEVNQLTTALREVAKSISGFESWIKNKDYLTINHHTD